MTVQDLVDGDGKAVRVEGSMSADLVNLNSSEITSPLPVKNGEAMNDLAQLRGRHNSQGSKQCPMLVSIAQPDHPYLLH